jgi:hypothetical protein
MALTKFTSRKVPVSFRKIGGGLNTTSGPLGLTDLESSDLQNIDFDKFGSFFQRGGYQQLNTVATSGATSSDGLYWYVKQVAGVVSRYAINVTNGTFYKMEGVDGTWDDITGSLTITPSHQCDFTTFLNEVLVTNNEDLPFKWDGTGNGTTFTVPTGLTKAHFITTFQNYTLLANCEVSGTRHPSRFYWSTIKTFDTWNNADFIDINPDDGQQITGFKVLGDRLVVYKSRSIYNVLFTGDRDVPFIVVKTNSDAGCLAPDSIQEIDNGHKFLANDGFYYFDGNNSFKTSDRITVTLNNLSKILFPKAVSLYQATKNRYVCTLGQSLTDEFVITWDSFNNAWSVYDGMNPSAMAMFLVNGVDDTPYFADNKGFVYKMDVGVDDFPEGVRTPITSYFYTNWKTYDDIVDQKGVPHAYIYYQLNPAILSVSYSYDFNFGDEFTTTIDTTGGVAVWDISLWDSALWAGTGGNVDRIDMTGKGRVIRFKFANENEGETFQIDGLGNQVYLDTNR